MQAGDIVAQGAKADRCPSVAAAKAACTSEHDFVMVHGDSDCSRDQACTRHPSNLMDAAVSHRLLAVLPLSCL
jgi:hypothetical protein